MQARRRPADTGAAAVEFALVSVMLFMVLFGIMQYGYGFFQIQGATAAAHEAARQIALGIPNCGLLKSTVVPNAFASNGLSSSLLISAKLDVAKADPGAPIWPETGDTVSLTLTYKPALSLPLVPYPSQLHSTAATTFANANITSMPRLCNLSFP